VIYFLKADYLSMAIVIGHRGSRSLAPENTLLGIRTAAQCGADMVEVDVRLSSDGALVLMHDETVNRTTNGSGKIESLSLDELKALDVGKEKIPTLNEAASLTQELDLGLVVEMKEEGLEELVAEELERAKQEVIITSFYHFSLRELKEISSLKTGIIISSLPINPVELALQADADAIFAKRVNPNLFKFSHRHGIKVYPWTVNEKNEAAWLLRLGADGLVTDNPCLVRKIADQPIKATNEANCEYYPCHHFEGQVCTFCFCPLYPCKDPELGRFVRTKRGKRVWTCIDCKLVHKPEVARYLMNHPDASTAELKAVEKGRI
jgi:glycerophosphoryl diester phosphodiesterase